MYIYLHISVLLPKGLTGTPGVQGAEGKPGPLVCCYVQLFYQREAFFPLIAIGTVWISFSLSS